MMRHLRPLAAQALLFLFLILASTGCESPTGQAAAPDPNAPDAVIGGAGSTFVAPLMRTWITDYQKAHPKLVVNYRSIGSAGGIEEFKQGNINFGASDAPLTDEQLKTLPPTLQVPVTAGPVCLVYNLTGLDGPLKLSADTIAGIYSGTIINWQDPAIAKDNPGAKLPKAAIMVVHRSDGSGTTNIFTTYLSAVSESWSGKAGHGLSVEWPAGIAAAGSTGVIDIVKLTPGTIGYLELNYAKQQHVPVASIRNRAGTYVEPTPASASEAADAFKDKLATDVRAAIVDPPATAKTAYPIVGFTFVLIPKERARRDEQVAVRDFLRFTLSQGQDASEPLHYAKLPVAVLQRASESLGQLTAAGQSLN